MCNFHCIRLSMCSFHIGAALSVSHVPAARPLRGRATVRRYSPATFVINSVAANTPGPLRHVTGFPVSDYYGSSAPIPSVSAGNKPSRRPADCWPVREPADASHVHFPTVRQGRCPAMPLQHRHGYAADIHHGLPVSDINRPKSSPHTIVCGCTLLRGPDPPGSSRWLS